MNNDCLGMDISKDYLEMDINNGYLGLILLMIV